MEDLFNLHDNGELACCVLAKKARDINDENTTRATLSIQYTLPFILLKPNTKYILINMANLSLALIAALASSASAFAPSKVAAPTTALSATGFEETGGEMWDPLGLYNLEDAADTFPNMFPKSQFIDEAEIKHGRMAMLAWTGVWATHVVSY